VDAGANAFILLELSGLCRDAIMSVKITQDETMTISGSSNWEKRKSFLSEEDGTYIEWTTYFKPPDSSWRLKRDPFTRVASGEKSPGVMMRGLCVRFESRGRRL
jgi:hypothetical protein